MVQYAIDFVVSLWIESKLATSRINSDDISDFNQSAQCMIYRFRISLFVYVPRHEKAAF